MKRISIMILASSAALTMLTACGTNETVQLELDPNMSISAITSHVSVELKEPPKIPASEEAYTEGTSNEFIESTETDISIIEYSEIEMPAP